MTEPAYTAADVELVASTFVAEAKKNPVDPATPPWLGVQTRMLLGPTEHDIARAVLDALVERGHGLAPVIAHQWSVRYPDGFVDGARFTEAGARQRAAELGGEVVYRAVGPWQPAERAVTGEKRADQQPPAPDPSGCPETQWDGPYRFRCGLGASTGVCGRHGRFRFPYADDQQKEQR